MSSRAGRISTRVDAHLLRVVSPLPSSPRVPVFKQASALDQPPPHPGELLREDIMPKLTLDSAGLARHLGVENATLAEIINEQRPVTLDLARRLGAAFGQGARFWLGVQMQFDLWKMQVDGPVAVTPVAWGRKA
jgi:antitoxin HigA-1